MTDDDAVFVLPSKREMYRVLFEGGRTMDVQAAHGMNSDERGMVLEEAVHRWGGSLGTKSKVGDWIIAGVAKLP